MKRSINSDTPLTSKPRLLRFGPGVIAAALLGGWLLFRQPLSPTNAPKIERIVDASPDAAEASAPDPAWLVDQAKIMGWSESQKAKMARLKVRWLRDTNELRRSLAEAESQFNVKMASAGSANPSAERIREWGVPLSSLSRQLAMARAAWRDEAYLTLTPAQRERANALWSDHLRSAAKGGMR